MEPSPVATVAPRQILVVGGLVRAPTGARVPGPGGDLVPAAGRYLVARRLPGGRHGGLWELPGGKVEPGEAPAEALRRELHEELGIGVEVGDVYAVGHDPQVERHIVLVVFSCVWREGEPACHGVAEWRWVTPAELRALPVPPADEPAVARLLRDLGP